MSEPITIYNAKTKEPETIYAPNYAALLVSQGTHTLAAIVEKSQTPEPIVPEPKIEGGNHIIDATAAAIRLAAEHGIDLVALDGQGTGDNGRILVSDIKALIDGD